MTRTNLYSFGLFTLSFSFFACGSQEPSATDPSNDGKGTSEGAGASGAGASGAGASGAGAGSSGAGASSSPGESPPTLPSSCVEPDPKPFAEPLESLVVGDGTAASCTNEAIQEATTKGGHITFDCGPDPVVIPISTTIWIAANTILDGGGKVTLDGGGNTRIIWMKKELQVEIHGFTFVNGSAVDVEHIDSGGAIKGGRAGTLYVKDCNFFDNTAGQIEGEGGGGIGAPIDSVNTIVNCRFENNFAGNGPGVHGIGAGFVIVNSVFANNQATTRGGGALYTDGHVGGGVAEEDGGVISVCGCRFSDNQAEFQGGAAYIWTYEPSTVRIRQCVFERNRVLLSEEGRALGGAVRTSEATIYVDQTLFVDNYSDDKGGAFWVSGDHPSYVTNSTFINNEAKTGGAITASNMEITNVTFDGNRAANNGAAISNRDDTVILRNSILRNNFVGEDRAKSCNSPITGSNNLQWPDPGSEPSCTEGSIVADPLLSELADNGGPTETMALEEESPAIGQGVDCPEIDQRGESRAATCALGAYER